uniref:Uncharacterized protein n=1 Tax=Lepeophtheirus salmonis TaxID=72036 RepID=A0A0K2UYM0_LEPSM
MRSSSSTNGSYLLCRTCLFIFSFPGFSNHDRTVEPFADRL